MEKKRVSLTDRLIAKLVTLGLTERKAAVLAKKLAPTARAALKAEQTERNKRNARALVPSPVKTPMPFTLPVLPMQGSPDAEPLRVMDGWTTQATYLVAAKKADGLIAVRQLYGHTYNVKFYPDMATWGVTPEKLEMFSAHSFLKREPYERMRFPEPGLEKFLYSLNAPVTKRQKMMARLKIVTSRMLLQGFEIWYALRQKAA